ncbi:MAG: 2-amino-4-hydroxy-6-hydroxymethyldihydropteridine diphosphokinase [Thermoleophilaceae bacterium]|nr:2-amino-4-hydroxy-6-hydroxymethyldihydropteridine diphosphokinase [Thermoleophilaceae bacterium]
MEGTRPLRGYLGLGSNVGDSLAHLRAAVEALPVVARSSVYRTEPQGEVLAQPDFLNAAVQIETSLGPEPLLKLVKGVEAELGRDFSQVRHGPRVVDIDLLLLGEISLRTDRLTLPHREVLTRRFVLVPLLELDPDLALPDGRRLDEALARLEGQRVERVGVL